MAAAPPGANGALEVEIAIDYPFAPCWSRAPLENSRRDRAPGDRREGTLQRAAGGGDLGLAPAEPQASKCAERDDLEEVHVRGLLGLVGGDGGVAGRMDLENEERLALGDHVAVAHPVQE